MKRALIAFALLASTALVYGAGTNSAPVISAVANTTASSGNSVWVTPHVTDDVGVGSVVLTYSTGTALSSTNTMFLETMGTSAVRPWTGTGCDNAWTVNFTGGNNPFEQRASANYGTGNIYGMEFKGGTVNLSDSMITTTQGIDARGNSGTIAFYLWANGLTGTAGWTMQLDPGTGFTTRLSELTASNHGWQLYSYSLQPGDLVSSLKIRFQFRGGATSHRIDLDQMSVKTVTSGTATTSVSMLDDGLHGDGVAGDGIYGAEIPAQVAGTVVNYHITATDGEGFSALSPTGAPANTYSYTVSDSVSFTPKYVRIPGGSYVMGDHHNFVDPAHPSDEIPLHTVSISPFYMSTTLLTCREYCDYLNAAVTNGLIEVRSGSVYAVGGTNVYFDTTTAVPLSTITWTNNTFVVRSGRDLHPITGVRWYGAIAYCNWLSARDGYNSCYDLSTGDCDMSKNGYRLPTEAEWEYAGRGGRYDPYYMFPWGDDTNADGTLANWEGSGDPWENGDYPYTTPVGFYNGALRYKTDYNWPATVATYQTRDGSNPYGLYDMAGNVWEWVNDWYSASYYQYCVTNNITSDPPGPTTGDIFSDHGNTAFRGLRGGTWWNGGGQQFYGYSRVSNRDPSWSLGGSPDSNPDSAWLQVGFRVMRPEKITQTVGLFLNTTSAYPGYTLMSPMQSNTAYLLNNAGQYVHSWTSQYNPGRADYLMENGHYIRECSLGQQALLNSGGGEGGRHEEYDWGATLSGPSTTTTPTP